MNVKFGLTSINIHSSALDILTVPSAVVNILIMLCSQALSDKNIMSWSKPIY